MGQSAANQEAEHYPSPERAAAKQQTPHPNSLHRVFPSVLFVGGAGFLFSVRRQQQPCRLSRCTARSDHDHNQNEEDRRCPDECIPIRDNGIIHDTPSKNPKIVGTDHPALPSYRCGIDVLSRQREKTDNRIPSPWFEFDCYKGHQSTKAIGDGNNRKIPKLFHQQGSSRCVPSALYDLNQQWKGHLLTGDGDDHGRGRGDGNSNSNSNSNNNNEDEEWSIYFHTEDAMTRLFRLIIAAQQQGLNIAKQHRVPLVVANEFPHLGQILRNCVDNGSFSKRLVWRFLCLYIFGGVYADLEYAPPPLSESGATSAILRDSHNDAILFLVPNDDNHQSNSRVEINTNLMAVSPEHPLMYYAVQHLLFLMTTDGYPWSGDDDDDDAAIQHRIVSTVLERALIDFVGDASDNGPVEDGAQQPTPSRGTIYAGTNRRTVSIVGTPGTNVGTATEAEFFETIRKDAETPTEVSTVSGNANQDQGSGGLDGPW
eukprot:CAMPEP_0172381514 /NCGR_PEP_ID=MMETSP1060-20121228/70987_1 /TAXON_ID=37318 /ORGANISM="Pseudo-nitzschia pungens, Strain cf. cingulata" /LENGTH=483 /DNA_ID=CAMNT_0013109291 /DNA_START=266 /DNA_END=1715 /DNA_ORIENTATION=-